MLLQRWQMQEPDCRQRGGCSGKQSSTEGCDAGTATQATASHRRESPPSPSRPHLPAPAVDASSSPGDCQPPSTSDSSADMSAGERWAGDKRG